MGKNTEQLSLSDGFVLIGGVKTYFRSLSNELFHMIREGRVSSDGQWEVGSIAITSSPRIVIADGVACLRQKAGVFTGMSIGVDVKKNLRPIQDHEIVSVLSGETKIYNKSGIVVVAPKSCIWTDVLMFQWSDGVKVTTLPATDFFVQE